MKICWQALLVIQESCANATFEPCELFILQCALSQSFQLVGKTTLSVCTHYNSGCDHIDSYDWKFFVVLSIHGCDSAEDISNWNVYPFLVDYFEG